MSEYSPLPVKLSAFAVTSVLHNFIYDLGRGSSISIYRAITYRFRFSNSDNVPIFFVDLNDDYSGN